MDGSGLAEGMIPGMLGLEMPLHQQPQQQQHHRQVLLFPPNLQASQQLPHHADADHSATAAKHLYSFGGGLKVKPAASPDDEAPAASYGDDLGMDLTAARQQPQQQPGVSASQTPSPWQRMKWTDAMVRLLIMVVYCVGDEGGADGGGANNQGNKAAAAGGKKGPCAATLQQQQKKGKWKSVSRAMMEKGYYVSPQQCEDKFNDLNKRYKRVNDLLGRGTACRVVENQALLATMDHLSPKAKEEARKLLNSKHLFFREMCAYHRSCAAAAGSSAADVVSSGSSQLFQQQQPPHSQACESAAFLQGSDPYSLHPPQQQACTHLELMATPADKATARECRGEDCSDEIGTKEEEDDEEDEDEDDDHYYDDEDEEEDEERKRRGGGAFKRHRPSSSPEEQHLKGELAALTGSSEQQRQWLSWRAVELEERRVSYGRRALELERQRLKWLRYSRNKERQMEQTKLENDRLSLENERMLLLLRHKEFEFACQANSGVGVGVEHSHNDGPSASAA